MCKLHGGDIIREGVGRVRCPQCYEENLVCEAENCDNTQLFHKNGLSLCGGHYSQSLRGEELRALKGSEFST